MPKRSTLYEVVIEGQRVPVEHPNRFILFLRAWDAGKDALVWQVSNVGDDISDFYCWFSIWRGMPHFRVLDVKTGEIFEPKLELAKVVHPEDAVVPAPVSV